MMGSLCGPEDAVQSSALYLTDTWILLYLLEILEYVSALQILKRSDSIAYCRYFYTL